MVASERLVQCHEFGSQLEASCAYIMNVLRIGGSWDVRMDGSRVVG